MKIDRVLIFVLIAILATAGITQPIYHKYKYPSSKDIPVFVEVVKETKIGFNTRTDALYFGTIPSGDSGRRFLEIANDHSTPVEVQIGVEGAIATWVRSSDNYFVLQPGEKSQISIEMYVPSDVQAGNYTGRMSILMKRV